MSIAERIIILLLHAVALMLILELGIYQMLPDIFSKFLFALGVVIGIRILAKVLSR